MVDDQPTTLFGRSVRTIVRGRGRRMKVAAHCATDAGSRIAAEGEVASFARLPRLEPSAELMKARASFWSEPTSPRSPRTKWDGRLHPIVVDRLRRAPTGSAFPSRLARTSLRQTARPAARSIELSQASSRPAWRPANSAGDDHDAARLLGMEKVRGAIAPGFAADLVATDENPLEKIDTLKHVTFVMKNGRVFRND